MRQRVPSSHSFSAKSQHLLHNPSVICSYLANASSLYTREPWALPRHSNCSTNCNLCRGDGSAMPPEQNAPGAGTQELCKGLIDFLQQVTDLQILGAGAFALTAVHAVGSSGGECAVSGCIHLFTAQLGVS